MKKTLVVVFIFCCLPSIVRADNVAREAAERRQRIANETAATFVCGGGITPRVFEKMDANIKKFAFPKVYDYPHWVATSVGFSKTVDCVQVVLFWDGGYSITTSFWCVPNGNKATIFETGRWTQWLEQ